jgi:hypothetical protein
MSKTALEIYKQMDDAMPFDINNGPKPYIIEAIKLYASEKVKEALELAAERAEVIFHDGITKKETHHRQVNTGIHHIRPNRGGILSLLPELLETINKEI